MDEGDLAEFTGSQRVPGFGTDFSFADIRREHALAGLDGGFLREGWARLWNTVSITRWQAKRAANRWLSCFASELGRSCAQARQSFAFGCEAAKPPATKASQWSKAPSRPHIVTRRSCKHRHRAGLNGASAPPG